MDYRSQPIGMALYEFSGVSRSKDVDDVARVLRAKVDSSAEKIWEAVEKLRNTHDLNDAVLVLDPAAQEALLQWWRRFGQVNAGC